MSKSLEEAVREHSECPECNGGLIEIVEFGKGEKREIYAFCGGINGDKDEGCGYEEIYKNIEN